MGSYTNGQRDSEGGESRIILSDDLNALNPSDWTYTKPTNSDIVVVSDRHRFTAINSADPQPNIEMVDAITKESFCVMGYVERSTANNSTSLRLQLRQADTESLVCGCTFATASGGAAEFWHTVNSTQYPGGAHSGWFAMNVSGNVYEILRSTNTEGNRPTTRADWTTVRGWTSGPTPNAAGLKFRAMLYNFGPASSAGYDLSKLLIFDTAMPTE